MQCVYINLDHKTDRKEVLEKNFKECIDSSWNLNRFSAINTKFVQDNKVPGTLRDTEKACFFSHKSAIKEFRNDPDHLLVMEDDICVGKKTQNTINKLIAEANDEWDIIYGEVCIPDPNYMYQLFKLRQQLTSQNKVVLLNTAQFGFAGATAYIINKKSKFRVIELLDKHKYLNIPYDLYLRELIHTGKLRGLVTFPFTTSFADTALNSDIRTAEEVNTDLVWIMYRKLVWAERNIPGDKKFLDMIKQQLISEDTEALATIIAATASERFVNK